MRTPPHDTDAERAVLGSILLDNTVYDRVGYRLDADDYYGEGHRHIWRALGALSMIGQPMDTVTVSQYLKAHGQLGSIGGAAYLIQLSNETPASSNASHYAEIVRGKSGVRKMVGAAATILEGGYSDPADVGDYIDSAQSAIIEASQHSSRQAAISSLDGLRSWFADFERIVSGERLPAEPTGYYDLDAKITGLSPGHMVVMAGRPGMGKTAFAMNIMLRLATRAKDPMPVHFFSLEMPTAECWSRLVTIQSTATLKDVLNGTVGPRDMASITQAIGEISSASIHIDDTPRLTIHELATRARQVWREHKTKLIIVDYLQLLSGTVAYRGNRDQEVSEISRGLKALAKELGVPVIALAQLNRGVESRTDKRPMLSDLRESGAIEQDADKVMFLYRDEYYHPETTSPGVVEIGVAKNRQGETGTVELLFRGARVEFKNMKRGGY